MSALPSIFPKADCLFSTKSRHLRSADRFPFPLGRRVLGSLARSYWPIVCKKVPLAFFNSPGQFLVFRSAIRRRSFLWRRL